MAAFAVATELKDQVKAAVEAEATGAEELKLPLRTLQKLKRFKRKES